MSQISGPVIVIDDGGVASLVVCCLCTDPSRVTPLIAAGKGESHPSRADAVRRRRELLGLGEAITLPAAETSDQQAERVAVTDVLVRAGREALSRGVSRVVWPIHCGSDLDEMERELERARLVERLVNLDAPGGGGHGYDPAVRVETPLLDLSDAQIAELAADLDAPLDVCWWCRKNGPAPCGRCGGCLRWEAVLGRVRVGNH